MAGGYRAPDGDGLGSLIRELATINRRLDDLERPSGTATYGLSGLANATAGGLQRTVSFLEGLTTEVVVGTNFTVSVANDALFHWYSTPAPEPELTAHEIATGRALITVTAGEVQLNPAGGFVQGLVGYQVKDSTDTTVPGGTLATAQRYGRVFTGQELNIGIRTPEVPLTIDPVLFPGPYRITAFFGAWVRADNTGACSFTFNDLSLRVDVLSTGVVS